MASSAWSSPRSASPTSWWNEYRWPRARSSVSRASVILAAAATASSPMPVATGAPRAAITGRVPACQARIVFAMLRFETAIGTCAVRWSERGLTGVWLPGPRLPAGGAGARGFGLAAVDGIVALLDGQPRDLRDVPLDEDGVDAFR